MRSAVGGQQINKLCNRGTCKQLKHRLLMDFSVDSLEGGEHQPPLHLPSVSEHPSHPATLPSDSPRSACASSIPTSPASSNRSALSFKAGSLSPWESWVVRKTREDIQQQRRKKIELEEKRKTEERQRQLLEEKQKKSQEEYLRWAKRKQGVVKKREGNAHLTTGKQAERKMHPTDEQLKEQYQAWCLRKLEKEAAVKKEEEERQRKETQLLKEKKERAEIAYKSWLERAGSPSPRPPPQARQRLVVPMASPPPSFTNPRPWIGPLDD
eukprot:Em0003g658a